MALTPLTVLATALNIAIDESKLEADRHPKLQRILEISAGKKADGTLCYRPWYAAAKALDEDIDTQALIKADGAEFTGVLRPIRSLYGTQQAIDLVDARENGVVVPSEFSAYAALAALDGGVEGNGEGVPVMSIQVG